MKHDWIVLKLGKIWIAITSRITVLDQRVSDRNVELCFLKRFFIYPDTTSRSRDIVVQRKR